MEGTIRVLLLDHEYGSLQALGVPLPLCVHLHELGLSFGDALWSTKQTGTGFSVTFFWPSTPPSPVSQPWRGYTQSGCWYPPPHAWVKPKRRRRRRHLASNKNSRASGMQESADHVTTHSSAIPLTVPSPEPAVSLTTIPSPEPAFSPPELEGTSAPAIKSTSTDGCDCSSSSEVDLNACEVVGYERRDGAGVVYKKTKNGKEKWTPVKRVVQRESEDSEIEFAPDAPVSCKDHDGTLWIYNHGIPLTPIAARTRKKQLNICVVQ